MADPNDTYTASGAPLAVNDLVISGIAGGDSGARGFFDAYTASTGERVSGVGEPGLETWSANSMGHGAATLG
jgi:alcohol dehydrogenase (cytochrome c)